MTRVLVLYGGRSSEHAISCLSARSVLEVIDRTRYDVLTVGITRDGRWTLTDGVIEAAAGQPLPDVPDDGPTVALVRGRGGPQLLVLDDEGASASASLARPSVTRLGEIDVAFPLLHGPWGEDGTVQGLLATVGIPYVGADVTASSIGIDKGAMKASFAAHDLPQGGYRVVHRGRWHKDPAAVTEDLLEGLALPWFVKPTRQGSSFGISKVHTRDELSAAMAHAYEYDEQVVVEEGYEQARELEVGVLGRDTLTVTRPGEIVSSHEFYDFDAKYLAGSDLRVPAEVPAAVAAQIDALARVAYRAIGCRGMARVDFFLTHDNRVVINEINTIPGFTPNSMFPRLWAAEGLGYPDLVERLLSDASI